MKYIFTSQAAPVRVLAIKETHQPYKVAIEIATKHQESVTYAEIQGDAFPIPNIFQSLGATHD